jgi:UDP-3-O-[3-hydroxymyristoyl] glucosamine N-acyltransferase
MASFTTAQLAEHLGSRLEGDDSLEITGLDTVLNAGSSELTFIGDEKHVKLWESSKAGCVVVNAELELPPRKTPAAIITVESADLAIITLLELFSKPPAPAVGHISESAAIDENVQIGTNVWIGDHCRIRNGCIIGDGTRLEGGVDLHEDIRIGEDCIIHTGASIYKGCSIGARSIIHANVVIGADGFGYRPASDGSKLIKIPHIGTVQIESDVEIGACTCIDRGKFGATRIGQGTKIDNLCQIGHNCEIGRMCIICGQVGIAGTTRIGDGTQIGGGSGLRDHLTIGRGVSIGAGSGVMNDIPDGEIWYGAPAGERARILREHAAIRRLPEWSKSIRKFLADQKSD